MCSAALPATRDFLPFHLTSTLPPWRPATCTGRSTEQDDILPLVLDLTNPSPGIGWENQERMSLIERGPADSAMALALIHHLAISNNLPFSKIAQFLSRHLPHLDHRIRAQERFSSAKAPFEPRGYLFRV